MHFLLKKVVVWEGKISLNNINPIYVLRERENGMKTELLME